MCRVGLTYDVLLHTKIKQKVIGNWFCTPIICKTPLINKKYTFTICVGGVWIVIRYFLFEKQAFKGLLKIIGIL